MEVKYYSQEKLLIFKITEEIDECKVKNIRRRADYEIERFMPKRVIFDFDSVTFMDSAGIGMIIGRYNQVKEKDGKIILCKLNQNIERIIIISGLLKICTLRDSEASARWFLGL